MIHAMKILPVTLQRTDDARLAVPAPMTQPVMVWVVETGMPIALAANTMIDPPADALNP